ncbi:MAG TPA: hypothetical protein VK066_30530 [Chloroflexota bacterium]|nr:hypothetical protein [Chloroflexota bacterium]
MEEPASADAIDAAVELILLEGLLESVAAKVGCLRRDLMQTRRHLQEVARLSDEVLAQVPPPNPLRTDVERIRAGALVLLALPSMAYLDY